ncbi:transglutaminase-like domain-containing protein [Cytophaga hutchinsonii]|jgi:transglutaminase-like putative cysteine protease|uniref:Transglutaminase-like enzymes, putative cysteine protease n=2 Tax=Cytophaga hutchinsonii (strain ATCC 33406 / DSM 1761 / CIP 103989 / NBRC 15051 / NCIMB 9469 / D465) TaxID=269798 RepID=A0A6N4STR6_CYTH3|nr:transglutaminase family protein [Cytophaga hutchinsonii]ABG59854.1 transglutaminase-like enzymes, putative cysteine protease [Cytophaga hutchinsonii ATCC 33406]SFX28692.1 Transglutaminase-like enzyme, putative cysteine protease [Cytophaga hutchinsonii ATCC 33406]
MKFKIHSDITYQVMSPTTFIFNVHALRTESQHILDESLIVTPPIEIEEFSYNSGTSRFVRLKATENTTFSMSYTATVDTQYKVIDQRQELETVPVVDLDGDIIPFLFPSRYCQSDKLQKLAYKEFGKIENVYSKVLAITDWIYNNVEYISGSTNSQTSAFDTITERAGVCRDFAHLGIALCRALSIPARYFTGYAFKLNPPDFHACFEAYIGGNWIIFDATRLVPLNGLVKIATGRDAADAAVASIFGNASSTNMHVECASLDTDFTPFWYDKNSLKGLSFQ